jgi:hypothetical protein
MTPIAAGQEMGEVLQQAPVLVTNQIERRAATSARRRAVRFLHLWLTARAYLSAPRLASRRCRPQGVATTRRKTL